MHSAMKTRYYV